MASANGNGISAVRAFFVDDYPNQTPRSGSRRSSFSIAPPPPPVNSPWLESPCITFLDLCIGALAVTALVLIILGSIKMGEVGNPTVALGSGPYINVQISIAKAALGPILLTAGSAGLGVMWILYLILKCRECAQIKEGEDQIQIPHKLY